MFRACPRLASRMSSTTPFQSAPFSRAAVAAMRALYPEHLADKSWDNTGLLLEAPFDPLRRNMNSVLLTVDLTRAVADEAIDRRDSLVVAYHPIIFRGLKALTMKDPQQQSLLRLAAEGISVYSPHTALDSAPGGINDWLADIITGAPEKSSEPEDKEEQKDAGEAEPEQQQQQQQQPQQNDDPFLDTGKRPVFMLAHHPSTASLFDNKDLRLNTLTHARSVIKPVESATHPGAGQGRIVRFSAAQPLAELIDRVARGVGNPKGFPVAIPQGARIEDIGVRSVGICAGSGGGLLGGLTDVDLLFTGELSHHEALAAIERGQTVITLFHSNTERGFLHSVLKAQLEERVRTEWETLRKEERERLGDASDEDTLEALADDDVSVEVSERDRDPYGIVIAKTE